MSGSAPIADARSGQRHEAHSRRALGAYLAAPLLAVMGLGLPTPCDGHTHDPPPPPPEVNAPPASDAAGPGDPALDDATTAQRGRFRVQFHERSPFSDIETMRRRMVIGHGQIIEDYDLAAESFDAYVPVDSDPARPHGLLVWVSAIETGAPPEAWLATLDAHDLLWIGANGAGNPRLGWHRFGLALDAVHNMTKRYAIDDNRVYVAGMSGGGRIASRMGVAWAEVFDGALSIVGCDFYRKTPSAGHPGQYHPERYQPPPRKMLEQARQRNRYVLLTGETDFNRDETKSIYEHGFVKAGFKYATYFEVPGLGHELPNAEWLAKCIEALDAPLAEITLAKPNGPAIGAADAGAQRALDAALALLPADVPAAHDALERIARRHAGTPTGKAAQKEIDRLLADPASRQAIEQARTDRAAAERLAMARNYLAAGGIALAKAELEALLAEHPNAACAAEAAKMLEGLDDGR